MKIRLNKQEKKFLESIKENNSVFTLMYRDYNYNGYMGESEYTLLRRVIKESKKKEL